MASVPTHPFKSGNKPVQAAPTKQKGEKQKKKRWGDEDSSDDEWTKAQNTSFASAASGELLDMMETEGEAHTGTANGDAGIEKQGLTSALQRRAVESDSNDISRDDMMVEDVPAATEKTAQKNGDEPGTEKQGISFAEAVSRQLFTQRGSGVGDCAPTN
jgi:hypothetical protein